MPINAPVLRSTFSRVHSAGIPAIVTNSPPAVTAIWRCDRRDDITAADCRRNYAAWDGKVGRICEPYEAACVKLAAAITQELRRKK